MRYYTIQDDQIILADNETTLTNYYENVFELPEDYEIGKYIIGEIAIDTPDYDEEGNPTKSTIKVSSLVLNPNWEEEKQQQEILQKKEEIKTKLEELDKKRIRAICENEIKDENTGETWIEYYNEQAVKLRNELSAI